VVRVQILSTYFAPEHTGNAPYVTALARHLSRAHDVTVIAGLPHYPEWRVAPEWRHWRSVEHHDRLKIIRLAHYVPTRQDSVRRSVYELTWAARALVEGLRQPADIVIGVVPTLFTSQVAKTVARRHSARLGIVVQDLVSRAAAQTGIKGGAAVAATARRLERSGLRGANGVCTIHPRFAQALTDEYAVPASSVAVIYNWSHIELPGGDRLATRKRLGWRSDEIVVLHSGNMGLKQELANVVRAARLAEAQHIEVRFVLAGDGNQRGWLETLGNGAAQLEVRGPVSTEAFPDFLAAADILLVNERAGVFEMSLPSKLTSYLAAGRPILAATESQSATAEMIEACGGGVVTLPSDPQALLDAAVGLGSDPDLAEHLGVVGQRFASDRLDEESALVAYQRWVEEL
jgi:colanic acid biosynthesis glycosyl transferase WcaI